MPVEFTRFCRLHSCIPGEPGRLCLVTKGMEDGSPAGGGRSRAVGAAAGHGGSFE